MRTTRSLARILHSIFRACLHGGGVPQIGEVTHLGGVTRLSIISDFNVITFTC